MKIKELKDKSQDELIKTLKEKRETVRQLRFDISSKQIKNVRDIRKAKKDIARILTLINQSK